MAFEPDEDGQMGTKRHKPEDVVAKLRQVDVLVSQGQSVAEAIRAIGVTEVTYGTSF
jgi:putative transposase